MGSTLMHAQGTACFGGVDMVWDAAASFRDILV
ncbi:hypothetical protein L916_03280 [Phytophthora nicotianae]|uniref:Uncharacterized protein n=1 Tax=Phytophthora nicotianae TaxID=4792 RepID=W2JMD8_PHYNI|nr:hypothetical protein L916_03280 [Phytophthora nicotianae]